MNTSGLPTFEAMKTLISYLPRLYAEGFSPVKRWDGGEKLKDGSLTLPYPAYDPLVEEFFGRVSSDGWLDHEYDPNRAYAMLRDEQAVRTASLQQIQTMLTFCVRGERFSDGHWAAMIEKGYIRRILERLHTIRAGM